MKILYVSVGGFGDASWTTSWPRIFSEAGHEIDVFLLKYTGNPFHANPHIGKMYVEERLTAYKKIGAVIESSSYDYVLIPNSTCGGVPEIIEETKSLKNVYIFQGLNTWCSIIQTINQPISNLDIPPLTKPEWYFTREELKYVEDSNLKNSIVFHPLSSDLYGISRNISFDLIIECSGKFENVIVLYGGTKFLPVDDLKRLEAAGVRLLWEDYNCFNDESGSALGKFLALTSLCKISIHAWSGSFVMPLGFNKPYIINVSGDSIRANSSSPYIGTKGLFEQAISRSDTYGCLRPSAWCITDKAKDMIDAINYVQSGKTGIFDKEWIFKE